MPASIIHKFSQIPENATFFVRIRFVSILFATFQVGKAYSIHFMYTFCVDQLNWIILVWCESSHITLQHKHTHVYIRTYFIYRLTGLRRTFSNKNECTQPNILCIMRILYLRLINWPHQNFNANDLTFGCHFTRFYCNKSTPLSLSIINRKHCIRLEWFPNSKST